MSELLTNMKDALGHGSDAHSTAHLLAEHIAQEKLGDPQEFRRAYSDHDDEGKKAVVKELHKRGLIHPVDARKRKPMTSSEVISSAKGEYGKAWSQHIVDTHSGKLDRYEKFSTTDAYKKMMGDSGLRNQLTINLNIGKARRVVYDRRVWWVAPITSIIRNGVLNGSDGALHYPVEETCRMPESWDGVPITNYHPFDPTFGQPLGVHDLGVWQRQVIGHLRNSRCEHGTLKHEGWFDETRTDKINPQILRNLKAGTPMEVSTGLHVEKEWKRGTAENGQSYVAIAKNYKPDHLAILPDQKGACSIKDGCGVLVGNQKGRTVEHSFLGWLANLWRTDNASAVSSKSQIDDASQSGYSSADTDDAKGVTSAGDNGHQTEEEDAELVRPPLKGEVNKQELGPAKIKNCTCGGKCSECRSRGMTNNVWSDAARQAAIEARSASHISQSASEAAGVTGGHSRDASHWSKTAESVADHKRVADSHRSAAQDHKASVKSGVHIIDRQSDLHAIKKHMQAAKAHDKAADLKSQTNNQGMTNNVWSEEARRAAAEARKASSTAHKASVPTDSNSSSALPGILRPDIAKAKELGHSAKTADDHHKASIGHLEAALSHKILHAAGHGKGHLAAISAHRKASEAHDKAAALKSQTNNQGMTNNVWSDAARQAAAEARKAGSKGSHATGIENPNSSGQGHSELHQDNPHHGTLAKHGFQYSHTTPITKMNGEVHLHHTYTHPSMGERKVGVDEKGNWSSKTSSSSGRSTQGKYGGDLDKHLSNLVKKNKVQTNNQRKGGATMAQPRPSREEAIEFLTQNCEHWTDKADVLNSIDDAPLQTLYAAALVANQAKQGSPTVMVFNAMDHAFDVESMKGKSTQAGSAGTYKDNFLDNADEDADPEDSSMEEGDGYDVTKNEAAELDRWLKATKAPSIVRKQIQNLRQQEQAAKLELAQQLVNNAARVYGWDDDERQSQGEELMRMGLDQLRRLATYSGATRNAHTLNHRQPPSWLGNGPGASAFTAPAQRVELTDVRNGLRLIKGTETIPDSPSLTSMFQQSNAS